MGGGPPATAAPTSCEFKLIAKISASSASVTMSCTSVDSVKRACSLRGRLASYFSVMLAWTCQSGT